MAGLTEVVTVFFVSISLGGEHITNYGPMSDGSTCWEMKLMQERAIERGFEKSTTYGITGDAWGIGNGAIYRNQDYKLECVTQLISTVTGEVVDTTK